MLTIVTAMAAAAAVHTAQPAPTRATDRAGPKGQMDHSQMSDGKMPPKGEGCCVKGPDGKMECRMMQRHSGKAVGSSNPQGHSGH